MTYQVIAQHSSSDNTLLCPMLDARRMEVYTLLAGTDLKIIESTEAKVIDELSYQSWLEKNKILFFGNGSDKCKEMIRHENAVFIPGVIPSAAKLGEMAFRKFSSNQFESARTYK